MHLRKHQAELDAMLPGILAGDKVRNILIHVTPGGGKSLLVAIIAKHIEALGLPYKVCWVVPRLTLREQGDQSFAGDAARALIGHAGHIRPAKNEDDMIRGTLGYITTYQSINRRPEMHLKEFEAHPYILFLDECHHVATTGDDQEAAYYRSVGPLFARAKYRILASGTLERHDGRRIGFLPYRMAMGDLVIDKDSPNWRTITYSRLDALKEQAIVPLHMNAGDGEAQWLDEFGELRSISRLADAHRGEQSAVLKTILSTDYAYRLLDKATEDWLRCRRDQFPHAKMLVVAPRIETAREYHRYLANYGAVLAVSDGSDAHRSIKLFKGSRPILVTVGMAYEGLDVPEITHVACLTNVRSKGWLEQCFDRANRLADGKVAGHIFYPGDPVMAEVVASIEGNVVAGAKLEGAKREVATSDREESALIQPIGSALSTMATKLLGGMPAYQPIAQVYTHADVEQAMRDLIAGHIRKVCRGDTHRMSMMKRQARLMHGDGTPIETANLALLRQIARGLGVDASRWPVVGSARVEIMTPVVPA